MQTHQTDIAIVGGGLVGLCAAIALQGDGQRISILEAADLRAPQSGGLNTRSIALSYSSVQIFKALGVWPQLKKFAAPIETIHISSQGHWGRSRLKATDYGLEALGYVIENSLLSASLLDKVEASENISLSSGAQFESIENGDQVEVCYQVQKSVHQQTARLALIADGAMSAARADLGITHKTTDYAQSAVITNVEFDKALPTSAYERFTDQGPLAMLPLGGNRYACVWTRDRNEAESLVASDQSVFIDALQQCFGYRLGMIEQIGERFAFDLKRIEADQLHQGRCLIVGNAANALHPVAGQGFNLALRDIATLYQLFDGRAVSDLDSQSLSDLLQQYAKSRKTEQKTVVRLGDGLVSLFSNPIPILGQVRAGGLAALELLPALKTQVAMSGMGMAFGGNSLLRGRL